MTLNSKERLIQNGPQFWTGCFQHIGQQKERCRYFSLEMSIGHGPHTSLKLPDSGRGTIEVRISILPPRIDRFSVISSSR